MNRLTVRETALFGIYGAIMYAQKAALAAIPNVHLGAVIIVALTLVYRKKALYPIYVYIFLEGLFGGFTTWWVPYLYVWALLWLGVMVLPEKMPERIRPVVYMTVCALHGFLFGTLFAPAQALFFGLDLRGMLAWIAAGLSFDLIHGVSNFCLGILVIPVVRVLKKLENMNGEKNEYNKQN